MTQASDPSHLLAQLEAFTSEPILDPLLRKQLCQAATKLSYRLEDPATAMFRYTFGQATQSSALKIALDMNIFPNLVEQAQTLEELAKATSVDPVLLLRVLRCLSTFGITEEHSNGTYRLSSSCQTFGNADYAMAMNRCIELVESLIGGLPQVVRKANYRNPDDRLNGAAQLIFNAPNKELFDILRDMGMETVKAFSTFLSVSAQASAKIYDVFPIDQRLVDGFDKENAAIFWVDVGGGFGQYTIDVRRKLGDLSWRYVVQDLAHVIGQATARNADSDVEFQVHDFFKEQPLKGARTYYFRQCFHNWQDQNCRVILEKTAEAMQSQYSRLLIHEIVMPEQDATPWEVMMDMLMMAGYSTLERSERQWRGLIESAGLKINAIYSDPLSAESIIEIVKD